MMVVSGWFIPPPSEPVKTDEDLRHEREAKIAELERRGLLRSERLRRAVLTVCREDFIPRCYRDHAYEEIPLPLPGERAAISCPHSYPMFYEPLGLS
jgi:protein-L-isoaspartate(D-aspartate) O-methyltransferase